MLSWLANVMVVAGALWGVEATEQMNGMREKGGRLSVNAAATMPVRIDAGWYSFPYSAPGTIAYRTFGINNDQVVQLEVIGCFCPGNFFAIYDNGVPIMVTDTEPSTAEQPLEYTCIPNLTNPNDCAADRVNFAFDMGLLLPGQHNITIVVKNSPYLGGTAFLRVDTICTTADNPFSPRPCCALTNTCATGIVA